MLMKPMRDEEFHALLRLPASDRYELFIKRVADWEEVWSLRADDGWSLLAGDDGVECIPVWPHPRFAEAYADLQQQEKAAMISLDDWLNKWLPGMMRDGRQVTVFSVPSGKGVIVSPDRLKADLLAECEQYE